MVYISFVMLILTILIFSAIVSGSETALLSVSLPKIKELKNNSLDKKIIKKAKYLLEIKINIQKHISTIVVLNNIINIVGSIYVGVLATQIFGEFYVGIVSAILTFLIILFAEIIPKLYGEKYSLEISLTIAFYLKKITWILSPILKIIEFITNIFVKDNTNNVVSEGEIKELAAIGQKEGSITKQENERISNVFKLDEISAYDIMIPKNKATLIDYDANYAEVIKIIQDTGFTRIPIKKDDEIIGLINAKDLFKYYDKQDKFMIRKILRPIIYAPEGMKLNLLEEEFKKQKCHLGIVINEHEDFIGVVSFEDIIEEIVGDIEDEFDEKEKPLIKTRGDNLYLVDTSIHLDDIQEELGIELEDINEEYSTLNGYLIDKFGKIPKTNQKLKYKSYSIRILKVNKKRIIEVEIYIR